jgi:AcrR family transcriptional regulator
MPANGRRRGKRTADDLALAAADWVIEHGLADMSLRRLAAGLEVSHRTLLYHFGSKDELFQAILRAARTRERLRAEMA